MAWLVPLALVFLGGTVPAAAATMACVPGAVRPAGVPGFVSASVLGSGGQERVSALAVTLSGRPVLVGTTASSGRPGDARWSGGLRVSSRPQGGVDGFVATLDRTGTCLERVRLLPWRWAIPRDVATIGESAFVVGARYEGERSFGWLARVSRGGVRGLDLSRLTGLDVDAVVGVAADGRGGVVVVGSVVTRTVLSRAVFPAPSPVVEHDVLVARLDRSGERLRWARTFGGSGDQVPVGLAASRDGLVVIGFSIGEGDGLAAGAFALGLTSTGERRWAVALGDADPSAVALDPRGRALVVGLLRREAADGYLASVALAGLPGPDATANGAEDMLVVRIGRDGRPDAAGLIGGTAYDEPADVTVADGRVLVVGSTASHDGSFPSPETPALPGAQPLPIQPLDAFLVTLDAQLRLSSASFIGGVAGDMAAGVAARGEDAIVAGTTRSDRHSFPDGSGGPDLPGLRHHEPGGPGSSFDAFLVRIQLP